jgi:hypothetical protein
MLESGSAWFLKVPIGTKMPYKRIKLPKTSRHGAVLIA